VLICFEPRATPRTVTFEETRANRIAVDTTKTVEL
jgi:hypothetical protein